MTKRLISIALLAFSVFSTISAQSNSTTSPYSRYGIGVLSDKGIGASKGMGGISYGIRTQSINPGNPASYSGVDSLTFIFDMGVSFSQARLSQKGASQTDDVGGLDYLSMQFLLTKKLGFSVGFLPYSSVGYSFGDITKANNIEYQTYYSGTGAVSQIYGGIAYEPIKNLSVGVNVAYLYGSVTHTRSLSAFSNSAYSSYEYKKLKVASTKFDIGLQYQKPIFNNKKMLTLGAVYTPSINSKGKGSGIIIQQGADTTLYKGTEGLKLPHTFGLGFTLSDRKLLFGADVTFQKWKDLEYPSIMNDGMSSSDRFNNKWKVNAGAEYAINPNDRSFLKRMKFRGGLSYSNSYVNVNTSDAKIGGYNEYGATLGFGLPFRDNNTGRTTYVNIGFEYNRLNPESKATMVKEEYFGVSVGVNLNDLWFLKNKFK